MGKGESICHFRETISDNSGLLCMCLLFSLCHRRQTLTGTLARSGLRTIHRQVQCIFEPLLY